MSTLKRDRHESKKFMVYEKAKELRNELARYILRDFDASGALSYMGPDWLSDERHELDNDLREICGNIQEGNAIHMKTKKDYYDRRACINRAIAYAKRLSTEMDWITEVFEKKINVDKYIRAGGTMSDEIKLLKGWRRQTDKIFEKGDLV
jgi:hypothetical protein